MGTDPTVIYVPSAEWQDIDLTPEQQAEWMAQVEPPPPSAFGRRPE